VFCERIWLATSGFCRYPAAPPTEHTRSWIMRSSRTVRLAVGRSGIASAASRGIARSAVGSPRGEGSAQMRASTVADCAYGPPFSAPRSARCADPLARVLPPGGPPGVEVSRRWNGAAMSSSSKRRRDRRGEGGGTHGCVAGTRSPTLCRWVQTEGASAVRGGRGPQRGPVRGGFFKRPPGGRDLRVSMRTANSNSPERIDRIASRTACASRSRSSPRALDGFLHATEPLQLSLVGDPGVRTPARDATQHFGDA